MAITKDDVTEFIQELNVKVLADLISELEEELGESAAAPVAVAVAGAPAAGDAGKVTVRVEVTNQFEGKADRQFEMTVAP